MKNLIFLALLFITNCLFSQKIDVKGNWNKTIGISEINEAGNDYYGTYISDSDESSLTIDGKKRKTNTIYVHKEDNWDDWHQDLNLQIRRTGRGKDNNNYNIYGGESFQTITNNYNFFFYTDGDQKKVPIEYKITGISVLLPVQDYKTTIIFTVVD